MIIGGSQICKSWFLDWIANVWDDEKIWTIKNFWIFDSRCIRIRTGRGRISKRREQRHVIVAVMLRAELIECLIKCRTHREITCLIHDVCLDIYRKLYKTFASSASSTHLNFHFIYTNLTVVFIALFSSFLCFHILGL